MKKRRKLWLALDVAALASTALLVLLVAAWIRSYFHNDTLSWQHFAETPGLSHWRRISLCYGRGQLRTDVDWETNTGLSAALPPGLSQGFAWTSMGPYPAYEHIDGPNADFARFGIVFIDQSYTFEPAPGLG